MTEERRAYAGFEVHSHPTLTPDTIQEGDRVKMVREHKGNQLYRRTGDHYWVVRKLYTFKGEPYAELERREHPRGLAYLQARIDRLCEMATIVEPEPPKRKCRKCDKAFTSQDERYTLCVYCAWI